MKRYLEEHPIGNKPDNSGEEAEYEKNFHKLKLNENQIKVISTKEDLTFFLDALTGLTSSNPNEVTFVGVDTEWKV